MAYVAVDVPKLSTITDMSRMFSGVGALYGDISGWDVSNVTEHEQEMFAGVLKAFNPGHQRMGRFSRHRYEQDVFQCRSIQS